MKKSDENFVKVRHSGPDFYNNLPTEEHLDRVALAALIQKMRCEICNKEFSANVKENL